MQKNQPSGAGARAAADAAQASLNAASEASQKVFSAWAAGAEASLKAVFDAQDVALRGSISLLETPSGGGREALKQWSEQARKAQQAALEAFRTTVGTVAKAGERSRPA